MASSAPNQTQVARAAAILTTGEVAAASRDLNDTFGSEVSVQVAFTKGSLTNVILRTYVSVDSSTWVPVETLGGGVTSYTLTADATVSFVVKAPGWKWFRVSAQGTGTVTSSSLALTYRYLRRGSQY